MNRVCWARALTLPLTAALAGACYFGFGSAEAEAAGPQRGGGFDEGGYVYLTAPSFVLPFAEDDFIDLDPSFGYGFGGGYMFARGKLFKASVGGVLEHSVIFFDRYDFDEFGAHVIRFMPEARIGAGTNKVWGYGLFGAGVAGALWNWNADLGFLGDLRGRNSAPGFNVQVGGGVQGIVWNNLFIGGEVDLDFGLFFEGDDNDWANNADDDFGIYTVAFEVMIGWCF